MTPAASSDPSSAAVDGALRPYVPRLAADWIARTPDETGRLLPGTLVSADISGFTRLTEQLSSMGRRGAEELTDLLNSCFDSMIRICLEEGGDVIKFGGDALLVLFTGDARRRPGLPGLVRDAGTHRPPGATAGRRHGAARDLHRGPQRVVPRLFAARACTVSSC